MKTYTIEPLNWDCGMAHLFDGEITYQIGMHPDGGWFSHRIEGVKLTNLKELPLSITEEIAKNVCWKDWQSRISEALMEDDQNEKIMKLVGALKWAYNSSGHGLEWGAYADKLIKEHE